MELYRHYIVVNCEPERRMVFIEYSYIDEAISVGIIFFDKYARNPGDSVIVGRVEIETVNNEPVRRLKDERIITLGRNLNVEITVL